MAHVNWLGGLRRELHHIKVLRDGSETYEPAIVITRTARKGKAFVIPIECLWKYVEPSQNMDEATRRWDLEEFQRIVDEANHEMRVSMLVETRMLAKGRLQKVAQADHIARSLQILRTTALSLVGGLDMLEVEVHPGTAAQLLLWIQNRLDDLREHPEHPNDEVAGVAGEVSLFEGGKRIATRDLEIPENDLLMPVVIPGDESMN